jgi:hypothetical protein
MSFDARNRLNSHNLRIYNFLKIFIHIFVTIWVGIFCHFFNQEKKEKEKKEKEKEIIAASNS